ncbi:cyclin-domain-containing protein, partial [Chlamydoabsidia padenii]
MTGPQGVFQCLLLSCNDSRQLAELCACLVPHIWSGRAIMESTKPIYASSSTSLKRSINANVFKQFCHKIFKHTQISSGCILLALYYLQQLKSIYPTLRGTLGSEFRIFTTALILANKYLDDNTFTNKTWSEVSGIPIIELNVMEMEYLTALNYKLHVHCLRFGAWANQCQQWFQLPTPTLKRS